MILSILALFNLLNEGSSTYAGRGWTHYQILAESVNIFARSPFCQYGRGETTVLDGYDRDHDTGGNKAYIHVGYGNSDEVKRFSQKAQLKPKMSVPVYDFNSQGAPVVEGDNYGWWTDIGGNLETGYILAVAANQKNYTWLQDDPVDDYNDYAKESDSFDLVGRDHVHDNIGAVYMYQGEFAHWTQTQILYQHFDPQNRESTGSLFGQVVDMDTENPNNMLIGALGLYDYSLGTVTGGFFSFIRDPSSGQWTENQVLYTSDRAESDGCGDKISLYDEWAAVACDRDDDQGFDSGSIYMFREGREVPNRMWSEQQKIIPYDSDMITHVEDKFGLYVSVFRHTMAVGVRDHDTAGIESSGACYIWENVATPPPPKAMQEWEDSLTTPNPKPKPLPKFNWWTQQQKLVPSDAHAWRLFGAYTTLYQNLFATGAPGEAFSLVDWNDNSDDSSKYRAGSAYIFVKQTANSVFWSQQQKLVSLPDEQYFEAYYSDPYFHGSQLIVRDKRYGFTYRDDMWWDCLVISVYDHFGDGWGDARLVAHTPEGIRDTKYTDVFHSRCPIEYYTPLTGIVQPLYRMDNPQLMRYCPLNPEDVGTYKFHIPGGKNHKYHEEIGWEIKTEWNGKTYRGTSETTMYFTWEEPTRRFVHKPDPHDNIQSFECECLGCPTPITDRDDDLGKGDTVGDDLPQDSKTNPKEKPVMVRAPRELKSVKKNLDDDIIEDSTVNSAHTFAPSISPAPTLTYNDDPAHEVQHLYMESYSQAGWENAGSANSCYQPNFYIYDETGMYILYKGQLCTEDNFDADCYVPLISGKYIYRTTGAVGNTTGKFWSFCGQTGSGSTHMDIEIRDGKCFAYNFMQPYDFCGDWVGYSLLIHGKFNAIFSEDYPTLTSEDYKAYGLALSELLSDVVVDQMVVYRDENDPAALSFQLQVSMDKTGYDGQDYDSQQAVYGYVESKFSGNLASKVVLTLGTQHLGQHALLLMTRLVLTSMEQAQLVQTSRYDSMNFVTKDNSEVPTETQILDVTTDNTPFEYVLNNDLIQMFKVEAVFGYLMLGCLLIYGVFVIRKRYFVAPSEGEQSSSADASQPADAENVLATSSHNMLPKNNSS